MNALKRYLSAIDRAQQSRSWLAVAVATWKKFSDDQAGNLAALIAYYAFASIFPLLLVFVTILNKVLKNNAALRQRLLNTALQQVPGIHLSNVHGKGGSGFALVIGLLLTLYGARGVASAMQNAMNSVWEVPMARRPGFPWATLRSLGLIFVIGPGLIATITLSSIAGGTGHLGGAFTKIAAAVVALILNVGLFWLGFRLATAREVSLRDLRLSAILAAVAWQILQLAAGVIIAHQRASTSQYGVFGVVLGLLAWFYLQAQLTLYVAELNVVRVRRLWPRSLVPPPLTEADKRAYEMYALAEQRRTDVEVDVSVNEVPAGEHADPAPGAPDAPDAPGAPDPSGAPRAAGDR
jgi:membrane protein